jgi:hypothetical protein
MLRAVRRIGVLFVVAAGMATVTALPASAKEGTRPVHITASVSGPGLATPVIIRWGGDCPFPEYCGLDGTQNGNQLDTYSFLNGTGILGRPITGPGPDAAVLGPKYEITYRAVSRGVVMTAHQDLYPFGPGSSEYDRQRPWIYTLPGQRLFTTVVPGGWIMAPSSLMSILRDHGFSVPAPPATAWATAPEAAANAPAVAPQQPGGPEPWALALGALALAAMVAVGAAVGRARSGRRGVRPAVTS